MSNDGNHLYEFDEYALNTRERALRRNGELVQVAPKAMDMLILLVSRNGNIVSREDLLESVWHETFVEEGNINYTISLLRKTFGEKEFIKTLPKQGYVFTAEVRDVSRNGHAALGHKAVIEPPRRVRWVLWTTLAIGLLFATSFVMLSGSNEPPVNNQTGNAEARAAYTRGKMILDDKDTKNRNERAIDEFQKAVTLDPTFALAYVGLAEGFAAQGKHFSNRDGLENYAKARIAVLKAFALDGSLADAYSISGWIKLKSDWDFQGAENDLRRAIQINPESAKNYFRLSQVLSPLGRHDEALAAVKKAYELDPLSEYILGGQFPILEMRGEYAEGLKLAEKLQAVNKENPAIKRAYATFLYHAQDFAKVIEFGEESLAKAPTQQTHAWLSLLAAAYQKTGQSDKTGETLLHLEKLSQSDTKALYSLAMNYGELGRADEAILALHKCFELREERMVWLNVEPRFNNLRNDERFKEILTKLNL